LAGFAQQWNFQESVIVGERMRRDGLALRRAARKVWVGMLFGYGKAHGPFSVQEAASAYYLMRQRLLALYETSHAGRYRVSLPHSKLLCEWTSEGHYTKFEESYARSLLKYVLIHRLCGG